MPPPSFRNTQSSGPENLGRFALIAEATRLLSQVLEHTAAEDFGSELHGEQSLLLDSTLQALENVVRHEDINDPEATMNQSSQCLIARALLHEAHASRKTPMASHFNEIHVARKITEIIRQAREGLGDPQLGPRHTFESCLETSSPFLVTLIYKASTATLRMYQEHGTPESFDDFMVLKNALRDSVHRWQVAGAYLEILEARELSKAPPST